MKSAIIGDEKDNKDPTKKTFESGDKTLWGAYNALLDKDEEVKSWAQNQDAIVLTDAKSYTDAQDEKVKTGYIADIYGIRTIVIPQAVNTLTTSIGVRVPNDKIILMSGYDGDKPVKMVRSRVANVITRDGVREKGLDRQEYLVQMFWDCGIATKSHFGIQEV